MPGESKHHIRRLLAVRLTQKRGKREMGLGLMCCLVWLLAAAGTTAAGMFGSGRVAMISSAAISASQAVVSDESVNNSMSKTKAQDASDGGDSISSSFNSTSSHRKRRPPKRMVVSFVNGIYHTESEWQEICDELKVLFNQQEIRPFYNPSSGFWMRDALGAGYELVRRPNDLLTARKLAAHLRDALKEVGPNGRVLHLAHSGGAILTYLAAKYHLSAAETDRIDVTTFGGGRSITQKYFKGRVVNYYARNDPLVLLDRRAGQLVKRVPGLPSNKVNITTYPPCEVKDRKHNTSFVFLRGVANNPIFDHAMSGPTYLGALKLEAEDFQQRMARLKATEISEAGMIRKLRKQASELTGVHHFWGDVAIDAEVAMRRARKQAASLTGFHGLFSGKGRGRAKGAIIVTDADTDGVPLPVSAINETMEVAPALSSGDIVQAEASGGMLEWVGDLGKGALQKVWSIVPSPVPASASAPAPAPASAHDASEDIAESEEVSPGQGEVEVELITEVLNEETVDAEEGAEIGWSWARFVERVRGAMGGGDEEGDEEPLVEAYFEEAAGDSAVEVKSSPSEGQHESEMETADWSDDLEEESKDMSALPIAEDRAVDDAGETDAAAAPQETAINTTESNIASSVAEEVAQKTSEPPEREM